MKGNYGKFLVKITGILGLASASLLMTIPSPAEEITNPRPSIFNEPPYNRGTRLIKTTPVKKPTQRTTPIPKTTETKNLVVLLNKNKSFTILIKALTVAGLTDTLQGDGPFTIFAPTDEAFAKLKDKNAVSDLLKPENKEVLLKVLTYHVVSGKLLSNDLKSGEVKSLEGDPINVKVDGNGIHINYANVTKADIQGSNGVIHQIDNLLVPPNL